MGVESILLPAALQCQSSNSSEPVSDFTVDSSDHYWLIRHWVAEDAITLKQTDLPVGGT
jgi:hypothetical protein